MFSLSALRFLALGAAAALAAGCLDTTDSSDLDLATAEQAVTSRDSHQRPTDHGALTRLPARKEIALTDEERFHAWQFDLTADAELTIGTGPWRTDRRVVDTWVYLYKLGPAGWGSYVERRPDSRNPTRTEIVRTVEAGTYRVLVRGRADDTRGNVAVSFGCTGAGCPVGCVFGETFGDLDDQPDLVVSQRQPLTAASPIGELDARRIVRAVQQSSHTDVTTVEEAFARVDQGEINRIAIYEPAAARTFVAFEYGAGDNSYGAYFEGRSDVLVARIHDGDVLDCTAVAETCLLGQTFHDLRNDPAFSAVSSRQVTSPGHVVGVEAEQLVIAVHEVRPEVTTVAEALAVVQDREVNVEGYYHAATDRELVAFEYGAGDNSYGAVFFKDSLVPAAAINDGDFYGCSFFAARGGAQAGDDCASDDACGEDLTCVGIVAGTGRCATTVALPNEGTECTGDDVCGEGLVCAGATRGFGLCNPAWMRSTFSDVAAEGTAWPIPDRSTLTRQVTAYGLATVDTDVALRAIINHPRPSQLRVVLRNPVGTEAVVFEGNSSHDGDRYVEIDGPVSGFSGDESVNGTWTLIVTDKTRNQTGSLVRWDLTVTSRWD
jgi:subtilisin-like proprotein convertase family protein